MTKVRFHLGKGEHYMQWQIRKGDSVMYYDPARYDLWMRGCRLRNQRGTAERIHAGENKTVCAWVECDSISVTSANYEPADDSKAVRFNPRIAPYWMDSDGNDVDGVHYPSLKTVHRQIQIQ